MPYLSCATIKKRNYITASSGKADGTFPNSFGFLSSIPLLKWCKVFWGTWKPSLEADQPDVSMLVQPNPAGEPALTTACCRLRQLTGDSLVLLSFLMWNCMQASSSDANPLRHQVWQCFFFLAGLSTSRLFINRGIHRHWKTNSLQGVAKVDGPDCWNLNVPAAARLRFSLRVRKMCLSALHFLCCVAQ